MTKPKIALFFDWLNQWGGAERLLLDLISLYPDAPIYTLNYDPKKTPWLPKNKKIISSFINQLPFSKTNPVIYTPIYDIALEQFNFSNYDIVISTTSVLGHSLITRPETLFICYCLNPNRHLYFPLDKYFLLKPLLKIYQSIDYLYSYRPDNFLTISKTVSKRIKKYYHKDSLIIYPGTNLKLFHPVSKPKSDYYLTTSRLVEQKKIDLVIKACAKLKKPLIITNTGRLESSLKLLVKKLHAKNITFLGEVDENKLISLYQNCKALICPQIEDFGYTPIEAQACGRPVIAFHQGGFSETIINGKTGIFFDNQTVNSLVSAILKFENTSFKPTDCRSQSLNFSRSAFMLNFSQTVTDLWQNHQQKHFKTTSS